MVRCACITRKVPRWVIALYACVFLLIWSQQPETVRESENSVIYRGDIDGFVRQIIYRDAFDNCGLPDTCREGEFPFFVASGAGQDVKPRICYNGSYQVFPQDLMRPGMNLLLISETHRMPIDEEAFNLQQEGDVRFLAYLERVERGSIIFLVTFDDASRLSEKTKLYLKNQFGSHYLISLGYRDSWAFVGQKGYPQGGTFESVNQKSAGEEWAGPVRVEGCLSFPLKKKYTPLCGMKSSCNSNETAVNIVSASLMNTALLPVYFCVNGRENFANVGTEGINLLVYDLFWGSVVKSQSFDTHESETESDQMVEFLESVLERQLLIGAVYDDASRWLTSHTKDVLEGFGAIKIQSLTYKGMWVFVGMKGIKGASPFERLNLASGDRDKQSASAEISACIPDRIEGFQALHPSEVRRQQFCQKYPSYEDLCDAETKKVLKPIPLDDMSLSRNIAYRTPILIIGGADLKALQRCLDSLLTVPGLNRDYVYVVLEDHFAEPSDLVVLYGFRVREQISMPTYHENFRRALELSLTFQPSNPYVIVLEPYLEVSSDFLRYFSQTMHLLTQDRSLLTVSAWNPNGFVHSSGDSQLFYRTETFPGFGWVLSRTLMEEMKEESFACCCQPTWRDWFQGESRKGRESVIPDLSRVKHSLPTGFTMETPFLRRYLKDRISSNNSKLEPTDTFKLTYKQYETEIKFLIVRSKLLDTTVLQQCMTEGKPLSSTSLSLEPSAIYTVYFEQSSSTDASVLEKLAVCFGLFMPDEGAFRNWHESVVRFTRNHSQILLVGSKSKFFVEKPRGCFNCDTVVT